MIERSVIHVAGREGAGKTTFVEGMLRAIDAWVLAARCVRDDTLRESRESAPKTDPELRRYREAGASGVARFAFPASDIGSDAFFMTDLMADYSEAVVLEGDNPLGCADLSVFIASPLRAGRRLFVRCWRDRAKEAQSDRHKLDLVLDLGKERWAIEVKLTASPGPRDMGRLDKTADMIGASRRFLVSQTSRSTGDDERASCNLLGLIERLRQWPG